MVPCSSCIPLREAFMYTRWTYMCLPVRVYQASTCVCKYTVYTLKPCQNDYSGRRSYKQSL